MSHHSLISQVSQFSSECKPAAGKGSLQPRGEKGGPCFMLRAGLHPVFAPAKTGKSRLIASSPCYAVEMYSRESVEAFVIQ